MESMILALVSLFIFIFFVKYLTKNIKWPQWAKWRSSRSWNITFFDHNQWLKSLIILLAQVLIGVGLFLVAIMKTAYQLAMKIMPIPKIFF